jgi:hypothetical protein
VRPPSCEMRAGGRLGSSVAETSRSTTLGARDTSWAGRQASAPPAPGGSNQVLHRRPTRAPAAGSCAWRTSRGRSDGVPSGRRRQPLQGSAWVCQLWLASAVTSTTALSVPPKNGLRSERVRAGDTAEQAAMSRYAPGLSDLVSRIEALGGRLEQRSTNTDQGVTANHRES